MYCLVLATIILQLSVLVVLLSAGLCGKPLQLSFTLLLAAVVAVSLLQAVSKLQTTVPMTVSSWWVGKG